MTDDWTEEVRNSPRTSVRFTIFMATMIILIIIITLFIAVDWGVAP